MPVPLAAVLRAGLVLCALVRFARSDTAFLTTGDCSASESCVSSPNYPLDYDDYGTCTITPQVSGVLSVTNFSTEAGYDQLMIDGVVYDGTAGPEDVSVSPNTNMSWHAGKTSQSVGQGGWAGSRRRGARWAQLAPLQPATR